MKYSGLFERRRAIHVVLLQQRISQHHSARYLPQTERLAAAVSELAEGVLSKRWKKVGKRAHGLETLDADQRHELRKELKKLRYAVEFLSLGPPEARRAVRETPEETSDGLR